MSNVIYIMLYLYRNNTNIYINIYIWNVRWNFCWYLQVKGPIQDLECHLQCARACSGFYQAYYTLVYLFYHTIYMYIYCRREAMRQGGSFQLLARGWIVTHKRGVASVLSSTPFTVELRPARCYSVIISTKIIYILSNNCYHYLIIY